MLHLVFMLCFRSEVSVEEGFVYSSPSPVPTRASPQWQAGSFLRSRSVCQNHQRACLPPLSQTTAGYKHTLLFYHALTFCPLLLPTLYSLRSPSSPTLRSSIQIRMRVEVTSVPVPVCLPPHLIYSEMQRVWWMSISKLHSVPLISRCLIPSHIKSLSVLQRSSI